MSNPFTFGAVVAGNNFANREKEIKELTRKLKETVRIVLVAPRRYGKTSLVKNVLEILKKEGMLIAYIDLYAASSHSDFMELWATNVFRGSRSIATRIKDYFRNLRPMLSISADGAPGISFTPSSASFAETTAEVFDLAEEIAKKEKKRFVVVLDEFQELLKSDKKALAMQMRASIQHHSNVSYLFTGSESPILMDMFANHSHPFYQICTLMKLDKIPKKDLEIFIKTKFDQSGKRITPEATSRLLYESEMVPYYVQLICFNLWDHFRDISTIEEAHVVEALTIAIRSQEPAFHLLWEGLSHVQRNVLKAAAELRGSNLISKNTILQFGLKSVNIMKRSLDSLVSKRILRKDQGTYLFEDVLFGKWIAFERGSKPPTKKLRFEPSTAEWDVFISHATEDKDEFVRPLAEALKKLGLKVWYDEFTLLVGDSLRRSIDQGLKSCRYGIVVISKNFLQKEWPQKELDGLTSREIDGRKVILPIWHNVNAQQVAQYSPTLADRVATLSTQGMNQVINDLIDAMNVSSSGKAE